MEWTPPPSARNDKKKDSVRENPITAWRSCAWEEEEEERQDAATFFGSYGASMPLQPGGCYTINQSRLSPTTMPFDNNNTTLQFLKSWVKKWPSRCAVRAKNTIRKHHDLHWKLYCFCLSFHDHISYRTLQFFWRANQVQTINLKMCDELSDTHDWNACLRPYWQFPACLWLVTQCIIAYCFAISFP